MMPVPRSLGVYADLVFGRGANGAVYANMAFAEYLSALSERVDRLVIFGRLAPSAEGCEHALAESVEFVPLPYYDSVADLPAVYRTINRAGRVFADRLPGLGAVWLFGPHPVSLRFARLARAAGVRVALGVRQDQPAYMRSRLRGARRLIGVPYFDMLERRWRRLARDLPTLTAGSELAAMYGGPPRSLSTAFTLVRERDLAAQPVAGSRAAPIGAAGGPRFRVLSVGRLDPEKNPLLLPRIVARLRELRPDMAWRLQIAGEGPMEAALNDEIARLGVDDGVEMLGYVPYGDGLADRYAQSDVLLHVSHTEGLPQVLIEAMAAGLPIVATAVGGVPGVLAGTGAPTVRPDDADAAARAIVAAADDPAGREAQARAGLERARDLTIEAQQSVALAHVFGEPAADATDVRRVLDESPREAGA